MPVDNYRVNENDNRKIPEKTASCKVAQKVYGHKSTSKASSKRVDTYRTVSSQSYPLGPELQLEEDKIRSPSKFNAQGKRIGYGLWYNRPCYDHSVEKKKAGKGHPDRVRTINTTSENQVKYRYDDSYNSDRSSDWKERTGSTMKTAMLRGSSRNSSKRRETKQANFKEE